MKIKFCLLLLSIIYIDVSARNLCSQTEKTIFSFETKSEKILSICKDKNDKYLTYKFGTFENIELHFPEKLDKTSWDKFDFSGTSRSGGKINAGFGDYSLEFKTGKAEFIVFQQWSYEDNSYSIGITITGSGKPITIKGLKKTQEGSLVLLEQENKLISNKAEKN